MGRKAKFDDGVLVKKGPGRKTKKQKDPLFSKDILDTSDPNKKLSRHQQKRAKNRSEKKEIRLEKQLNAPPKKKKAKKPKTPMTYNSDDSEEDESENEVEEEEEDISDEDADPSGFTDDNKAWLTPKNKKSASADEDDDEEEESEEGEEEDSNEESDSGPWEEASNDEAIDEDDSGSEEDESDAEETSENLKISSLNDMSDDSDESDDEYDAEADSDDMLPIEKQNVKLKKKQAIMAKEAEDEMQLNITDQHKFEFPKEGDQEQMNLQDIQQRIRDIIVVLADFTKLRDKNYSRSDYLELLRKDLCMYYSYNEFLMEKLMQLFTLNELLEFLEASEVQRPLTIRTNTLKTRRRDLAQALINRGVNLDPIGKWSKVGLVVYSAQVPMGATPEYLAGHYIIQGASSLLPVMALAPQENERILDMCAAPGGKASHIAAIMKNTGTLFVNDFNADRIKAVVGNFHRLGIVNSIISTVDGRKFPSIMKGFDRIILDAPCTGTGVVAKDQSVKTSKDEHDIQRCYNLQRELLLAAIDSVNAKSTTGGYVVYSTCSILPEENEWVIDYALKKRNVKLVDTGLEFGTEGFTNYRQFRFHPTMKLTKRFYPHSHNMDGFFVAKFKKFSNVIPTSDPKTNDASALVDVEVDSDENPEEEEVKVEEVTKKQKRNNSDSDGPRKKKQKIHLGKSNKEQNTSKMNGKNKTQSNSSSSDSNSPKIKANLFKTNKKQGKNVVEENNVSSDFSISPSSTKKPKTKNKVKNRNKVKQLTVKKLSTSNNSDASSFAKDRKLKKQLKKQAKASISSDANSSASDSNQRTNFVSIKKQNTSPESSSPKTGGNKLNTKRNKKNKALANTSASSETSASSSPTKSNKKQLNGHAKSKNAKNLSPKLKQNGLNSSNSESPFKKHGKNPQNIAESKKIPWNDVPQEASIKIGKKLKKNVRKKSIGELKPEASKNNKASFKVNNNKKRRNK